MLNKLAKLSLKERVLAGALAIAVIGFIFAAIHTHIAVMQEARNPYAQSVRAVKRATPMSEQELQQAEVQLQPKNPVPKLTESGGVQGKKNAVVRAKVVGAEAPKSSAAK